MVGGMGVREWVVVGFSWEVSVGGRGYSAWIVGFSQGKGNEMIKPINLSYSIIQPSPNSVKRILNVFLGSPKSLILPFFWLRPRLSFLRTFLKARLSC